MIKLALKYLIARGKEPSSMAGLGVLFLVLERITGMELDLLAEAAAEALPLVLSGQWVGALIIIVPALYAMLKADTPNGAAAPPRNDATSADRRPADPPKGPPQPPGAQMGHDKFTG